MELIPLIYTVLIVVFLLTVITIVYSFISQKRKNKLNLNAQPPILTRKQKTTPDNNIPQQSRGTTGPTLPKFELNKNMAQQGLENENIEQPTQSTGNKKPATVATKLKRGEIIQNISPTRETKQKRKTKTKEIPQPGQNTGKEIPPNTLDDNIIDKYVDEDGKDLYTLNVKKNSGKKNN